MTVNGLIYSILMLLLRRMRSGLMFFLERMIEAQRKEFFGSCDLNRSAKGVVCLNRGREVECSLNFNGSKMQKRNMTKL